MMRIFESVLKNTPSLLMAGGVVLYFVPATWVELPIEPNTLGIALFGFGGVLFIAGWYDKFDTESDATADDPTSQTPARTNGDLATVLKYGPGHSSQSELC